MSEQSGNLLVVHHSPTPLLRTVRDYVLTGATHPDLEGVEISVVDALDATACDIRAADAIVLGTSANFGYISGALKHFFDSTFAECGEARKGLPFSYWIRGGHDTTGAQKAMQAITTGFGWELSAEPVCFVGEPDEHADQLRELGATMAAHALSSGMGESR
ncbi:flavodoxin [Corynebacterium sp. TAE3-ERU12]|uniref:flavodoxin family protein n=1 Tax=Corynebacterium sp. TAE3-ERU12 TaxID=2849491 RepID=UPI001C47E7AE|nr:flavodoxin [Corynebacterium sp. TAE3-ERU12]MBV7294432.1 flavodoxin [Corynebacterium sp. TAE3-ERU12]